MKAVRPPAMANVSATDIFKGIPTKFISKYRGGNCTFRTWTIEARFVMGRLHLLCPTIAEQKTPPQTQQTNTTKPLSRAGVRIAVKDNIQVFSSVRFPIPDFGEENSDKG